MIPYFSGYCKTLVSICETSVLQVISEHSVRRCLFLWQSLQGGVEDIIASHCDQIIVWGTVIGLYCVRDSGAYLVNARFATMPAFSYRATIVNSGLNTFQSRRYSIDQISKHLSIYRKTDGNWHCGVDMYLGVH